MTGGARLRLLRTATVAERFGQGLGEDDRGGLGAGLTPSPVRSCRLIFAAMFPSLPVTKHATRRRMFTSIRTDSEGHSGSPARREHLPWPAGTLF